jgi:putative ABC transport system substrate-binding protein
MSYGANLAEAFWIVGTYAGRILTGAKPSDLPVQQALLELVLNRTAAKALGITVPLPLLFRVDTMLQ